MDPANTPEITDREDGDRVPSRTPPSPGRSDPYASTGVWQPTRSNMPGESIHVPDDPKLSFPTPTPRLKVSHLFKRTCGTISLVEEIRSRRVALGVGAGPPRPTPRVASIPTATRMAGRRHRTRRGGSFASG
jgi:hypothetical protein